MLMAGGRAKFDEPSGEELARLWTAVQPAVAAFIRSMVPDYHQAQDILQNVAAVLVRKFDQYDPAQPFVAWAVGIARREVLAARRASATRDAAAPFTGLDDEAAARVADAVAELSVQASARAEALERCLAALDAKARRLVEFRYELDLAPAEIAARLGGTFNSVTVALSRIRVLLRECVERRIAIREGGR